MLCQRGIKNINQDYLKTTSLINNPIILKSFASQANSSCFNDDLRAFFLLVNKIFKQMKIIIN